MTVMMFEGAGSEERMVIFWNFSERRRVGCLLHLVREDAPPKDTLRRRVPLELARIWARNIHFVLFSSLLRAA